MMTQHEPARNNRFVGAILPWLVVAGGLLLYVATLNHWLSLTNLTVAGRFSGDLPGPDLYAPLYYLFTYPLHWIPQHWVPLALNLLSAVCGAGVLGLLARSVVLLPHDRTHEQRLREDGAYSLLSIRTAWLPPLLAALALGLGLTFWEAATTGAREMLDLLLFAYVIRCLLEYRISERDSVLYRAALACGAAMTEDWVMIGFLPIFAGSLIWIRGASFFNFRFLRTLIVLGLAGLSLYLLLPAIFVNSTYHDGTFWQALKMNLRDQKHYLTIMFHLLRGNWNIPLLLAVTSVIPLLVMAIKWASQFGDPSPLGTALTTSLFHLSHAALLGACVWVMLDPAFGPRHITGMAQLIQPLTYLAAMSIGYFSGYFLLVFRPLKERTRYQPVWNSALHRIAQTVVWSLLPLLPAALVYKNIPWIRFENGQSLVDYAAKLAGAIPDRAVVLADDAFRLLLAKSWIARDGGKQDRIFLNTRYLSSPAYFNQQQLLHPDDWLPAADIRNPQGVDFRSQIALLVKLSERRPIYYLQPSFGIYFEVFYQVPHGLALELRRYDTNSVSPPTMTESEIAENAAFWKQNETAEQEMLPYLAEPAPGVRSGFRNTLFKKLHIPFEPITLATLLGNYYSLSRNVWGVELQIAGKLAEAGQSFQRATQLNPRNLAAQRNLEFNTDLQAGVAPSVKSLKSVEDDFPSASFWQQNLELGGPYDEPTHRYRESVFFGQGGLYRQAATQVERIHALVPDNLPARLGLAQYYVLNRLPAKALALTQGMREQLDASSDPGISKYDILRVESTALFSSGETQLAEQKLRAEMDLHPKDINLLSTVFQVSIGFKSYTNALRSIDLALELKPDDLGALVNKGTLCIQLGDLPTAIQVLTSALAIETNNISARLNRAIAYLDSDQLDAAQQDYTVLRKIVPNAFQVYYGLGEIAWRKKDTNNAIDYYTLYLANAHPSDAAPAPPEEEKTISDRLLSLRSASP